VDAHGDWEKLLPTFRSFGVSIDVCDFLMNVAHGSQDDIADFLMRREQPSVLNSGSDDTVVAAMVAKNPALSRLMETFDCEIVRTEKIEIQPARLMTGDELRKLAAGLPDHHSFTEAELCRMLNIEDLQVQAMQQSRLIYFIGLSGKYCRSGCTPF
jgi:hypothetical protein